MITIDWFLCYCVERFDIKTNIQKLKTWNFLHFWTCIGFVYMCKLETLWMYINICIILLSTYSTFGVTLWLHVVAEPLNAVRRTTFAVRSYYVCCASCSSLSRVLFDPCSSTISVFHYNLHFETVSLLNLFICRFYVLL